MDIYCLNFNNYFNRKYKKYDTLAEYVAFDADAAVARNVINFNWSDGVDTRYVMTHSANADGKNYCICVDDNEAILARWFITEAGYNAKNQYELVLHRDVLAETEVWLNCPTYVERGNVEASSYLIHTSEGRVYSQIKSGQWLMKDATQTPWLVIYHAKNMVDGDGNPVNITGTVDTYEQYVDEVWNGTIADYIAHKTGIRNLLTTYQKVEQDNQSITFDMNRKLTSTLTYKEVIEADGAHYRRTGSLATNSIATTKEDQWLPQLQSTFDANWSAYADQINSLFGITDGTTQSKIRGLQNKVVRATDGLFRLDLEYVTYEGEDTPKLVSEELYPAATTDLYVNLQQTIVAAAHSVDGTAEWPTGPYGVTPPVFRLYTTYHKVKVTTTRLTYGMYDYTIKLNGSRIHTEDAPYDITVMPFGKYMDRYLDANSHYNDARINLAVATDIMSKYGTGANPVVYDIQILPYCPITEFRVSVPDGWPIVSDVSNCSYIIGNGTTTKYGSFYYVTKSSFTRPVYTGNHPSWFTKSTNPVDVKVQSETTFVRMCGPNYSSLFDLNVAKNGTITDITIAATYKPYNPYIHIYPNFGGLYGRNYKDNRGLLISGDFSITAMTDAFAAYERNNINYQKVFDRETQSLELQNRHAGGMDIANIVTSTFGGAAAGAIAGSAAGPVGKAVGAVVGAVGGIATGITDAVINKELREDQMSLRADLHKLSLAQIQALPSSIAKVTGYNIDNTYFPFMEYYKASDAETSALRESIKFNGMAIGVIGTITDYIVRYDQNTPVYVCGRPILLENEIGDTHWLTAIKNEIQTGVYV